MKRIFAAIVIMLMSVGMLAAQSSKLDKALDKKVKEFKNNGNSGKDKEGKAADKEKVRVIIQTTGDPDAAGVSEFVTKKDGKLLQKFESFSGIAAEISLEELENTASQSAVARISLDDTVSGNAYSQDIINYLNYIDINRVVSGQPQAWFDYGLTGSGIGVAVIDSGISGSADVKTQKDIDFTGQLTTADKYGHGTHVAGILAGGGTNSQYKFVGGAPYVNLVNLRVLDENGTGSTSNVIKAIEWAIANRWSNGKDGKPLNIRVINLSLGHTPNESALTDPLTIACRKAVQAGIVVVAAAGNYGKDANGNTVFGGITSPGTEPSVITVGAVSTFNTLSRADDVVASYSSRGPTIDGLMKPDIAAPGTGIIGPAAVGNKLLKTYPSLAYDANYMRLSGTSMAAPVVAAAVAMMLQKSPALKPNAVKAILMYTAEKKGVNALEMGAGYLNTLGALNLTSNINTYAAASSYWLLNNGAGLTYANDIFGGYRAVWGGTIVWDDTLFSGNSIFYAHKAWGSTIVWGDTIVWGEMKIVSGTTIVWESDVSALGGVVTGSTIVWESMDALNVEAKMFNVAW
jgi:serine protease AprX